MALVKCYDHEGNEHNKESVDARECIAHCGFTLELAVEPVVAVQPVAPVAPVEATPQPKSVKAKEVVPNGTVVPVWAPQS